MKCSKRILINNGDGEYYPVFLERFPAKSSRKKPIIDVQVETPYLKKRIMHIDPAAVLEIVAFDSIETYVIADNETVIKKTDEEISKS